MPGITPRRRSICHVATTFNQRSGCARRIASILEACAAEGYRTSLVVGSDHDLPAQGLPGVSVTVVETLQKRLAPRRDLATLRGMRKVLNDLEPELVHTHLAKAGILGRYAAAGVGVPKLVHTVHGPTFPEHLTWAKGKLFLGLERRAARLTHSMIYVGEELRSSFLEAGVGSRESSHVIRTALTRTIEPLSPDERQILRQSLVGGLTCDVLIVHIGRLVPGKRPQHAVTVLEELVRQGIDARLVLVGEALVEAERAFSQKLLRRVQRGPSAHRVHLTGFREDVLEILQCADVALLTSTHEGLPNVAVEAAVVGTPVVGYPVTGLKEVIEHGKTGWIATEHEPGALVAGLTTILQNPDSMRAHLARRADEVRSRHSREEMANRTLKIYESLLP